MLDVIKSKEKIKKNKVPKKIISVYLPHTIIEQIDSLAQANGLCRNSYLASFFALHFKNKEKKD